MQGFISYGTRAWENPVNNNLDSGTINCYKFRHNENTVINFENHCQSLYGPPLFVYISPKTIHYSQFMSKKITERNCTMFSGQALKF